MFYFYYTQMPGEINAKKILGRGKKRVNIL